jgi:hypothetical protein
MCSRNQHLLVWAQYDLFILFVINVTDILVQSVSFPYDVNVFSIHNQLKNGMLNTCDIIYYNTL